MDRQSSVPSRARIVELRQSPALLQILESGDRVVAGMVASEAFWLLVNTLFSLILTLAFSGLGDHP